MSRDPYYTGRPQYFGEQLPQDFFGPDDPVVDGQRWARYPRGFAWNGPEATNNLFDGAPPLNPFTGRPFRGATIDCPAAGQVVNPAGANLIGARIQVDVGDAGGGRAFREFIIGPGTPVFLSLGQYQSVKVAVASKSAAAGARMAVPARIQWTDTEPFLSNTGLLRAPKLSNAPAAVLVQVPDGAVEVVLASAAASVDVRWRDFTNGGAPADFQFTAVVPGTTIRTLGSFMNLSQLCDVQFFLAGL